MTRQKVVIHHAFENDGGEIDKICIVELEPLAGDTDSDARRIAGKHWGLDDRQTFILCVYTPETLKNGDCID